MHLTAPRPFLLACLALGSCGTPAVDLAAWRGAEAVARPVMQRGELSAELAHLESLRGARHLTAARSLALALAAEHPDDGTVAHLASRAESDGLVLFAQRDKPVRDAAALSAFAYAELAAALGEDSAAARAQHAWALGASTHLRAMGDRAAHATRTLEVAHRALELDPAEPTALATLAIVHLRLQTLPWIARVMASGLPQSSLEDAVRYAKAAVEARPSRENRLILARCLRAADQPDAARLVLEEGLAAPALHPRDDALEATLRAELE